MIRLAALLALGVLVASPAHAQKPQIQWDKDYDFSNVKTFMWQAPSAPSLEDENPFMHKFIQQSIETELQNAGFMETTENPDVYVTYHGSVNTEVSYRSSSFGFSVGSYGMGPWGGVSGISAGPTSTTTREVQTKKGTLIVDIVDAKEKQLVWRGTSSGILISDSQDKTEKAVGNAIKDMAKQGRKLRAKEANKKKG
ncbi:MAG TPA: DUF4136 domain-containing protein [Gammaproteobacteria bacterium]|nr:DUF4136 domain-containing protein [Gammaproteobacteria bacterium]